MTRQADAQVPGRRNDGTAIALHWITAILIVANLTLGLSMVELPISPRKLHWYLWHKSIGITIFLLTSVAPRLARDSPAPTGADAAVAAASERRVACAPVPAAVVIPVSGWLYSSATGVQVVYLGLVPLPNLLPKDKALGDALRIVHVTLNSVLVAVVCVHVAAAFKHHFVDRDAVLTRMLPIPQIQRNVPSMIGRLLPLALCALLLGPAGLPNWPTAWWWGRARLPSR